MGIADGTAALARNDWEHGLEALVDAWGTSRSAALAEHLEALSDHATAALPPLAGKRAELQRNWEGCFGEGRRVLLGVLLDALEEGTSKDLRARFDRLLNLDPDPRMTRALMRFPKVFTQRSSSSRPAWTGYFRVVAHVADPRMRGPLEAWRAEVQAERDAMEDDDYTDFEDSVLQGIDRVLQKLPEPGTVDLGDLAETVRLVRARPFEERAPEGVDTGALFDAVLASPADEGAVMVWIDALLEAGDARGRFAALQLEGESRVLKPKERKEEAALFKANHVLWLGSLGPAVDPKSVRFRRGLLSVATTKPKRLKPDVLEDPGWRTIEQISTTVAHLRHPNLVSLTRIGTTLLPDPHEIRGPVGFAVSENGSYPAFAEVLELAKQPSPHIQHLETDLPEASELVDFDTAFPALRTLALHTYYGSRGENRELAKRLQHVRDVIFTNMGEWEGASDAFWLEHLPNANVHFQFTYMPFTRSYVRGDDGLHVTFSETSTGLYPNFIKNARSQYPNWFNERLNALRRAKGAQSLTVRTRSTVDPVELAEIQARVPAGIPVVSLPRAKGS
ncbi:MAG: hypothetical protein R3F61_23040 [Myxococcota bacterium]